MMTVLRDVGSIDRVDVVVLTALSLEYDAVRAHLTDTRQHATAGGTRYEIGTLRSGRVALALVGEGNLAAAAATSRAIDEFAPKAVIFAGVAGGLTDSVALGDVVVATRVHAYHGGTDESGGFRPRPKSWPLAHALEQTAREVARADTWRASLTGTPTVHFKPVVSGEVVIATRESHLARLIAEHYSDAVAVDMESAGIAEAAHRNSFPGTITVRAVSDMAEGTKDTDAFGWQRRAAANAAAFAVALAERVSYELDSTQPASPSHHETETTEGGPTPLGDPFYVYVAGDDHAAAEALAAAIAELFAQQEIEALPDGPPRIASWFQRFTLRTKRSLSTPEIASRLEKVEHALEVVALHDPMSRVNAQHADAMAKLLGAAEKCDNFVALAGSIVLVKHTDETGSSHVYAKTLSVAEVRAFERNQHLLTTPAEALKHLRLLSAAENMQPTPSTNGATAPAHNEPTNPKTQSPAHTQDAEPSADAQDERGAGQP